MPKAIRFQYEINQLGRWAVLVLVGLLALATPAAATPGPAAPTSSLAQALNPDGTLRPGATGSFDARHFTMRTAPDGEPVFSPSSRVVGTTGSGDERWQNGFSLPNGTSGTVIAVVRAGPNTYFGGFFTAAGATAANGVVRWDGSAWSSLGTGTANGVNGVVYALAAASNGDLYVGGSFTQAGGVAANYVAKWNGTAWSSLGLGAANGLNSDVRALAVASNGDLYAGGIFTAAGGMAANYIAKWDGTAWNTLGTGTDGSVNALAVTSTGEVYAGGFFTQSGGIVANNIAKWNGTAWSTLGTSAGIGTNGNIQTLAVVSNGNVYVGGYFTQAGGVGASNVACWNGTTWSGLGTGTNETVYALTVAGNGDVYAGGFFDHAGGVATVGAAKWDGTAWNALGQPGAFNIAYVYALAIASNGDIYVGGAFTLAGGVMANSVAKWNGTAWSVLGAGPGIGINGPIQTLVVAANGDVYVGGSFTQAGSIVANNVAKWNGTVWSALGTGANNGLNGTVYALALASNGDVYVGGIFVQAGGVAANYVAKWNGTVWSTLGTGVAATGAVYALALASNGDLYMGGRFAQVGGVVANNVSRWNGTIWSALGTGTFSSGSNAVYALAVANTGDVYAGGYFTQAGGTVANNVAKWNGTVWSTLGTGAAIGVNNRIQALAMAGNGDLYAGGYFTRAGGMAANNIARWNGTAWSTLGAGTGVNSFINALAVSSSGDVYIGGSFTQVGSVAAGNVARWDGTSWSTLGTGLNNFPQALSVGAGGKVYAGGTFTALGDGSKVTASFAVYDPLAPLSVAAPAQKSTLAFYPNPAHSTVTVSFASTTKARSIQVLDGTGREVSRKLLPAAATSATLDLRGLAPGLYVVRCGTASGKLVVE